MTFRSNRILKILLVLLVVGSVLAAVKGIFVDYTLDEEYQVVMAYRNLSGDTLFGTMWEPHQSSAFLCVWLMRFFVAVTGTFTGVVIFLRIIAAVIQLLLSLWLYRALARSMRKEYAFLLGSCYFNIVPKMIQIPDFSNLQVWFFTVTVLSLMECRALEDGQGNGGAFKRMCWLVVSGLGMALEVLAYPSAIVLFPFFLICIFRSSKRVKDCLVFAGTCVFGAFVWMLRVLSRVTPREFLRNVRNVVSYDATHDVSLGSASRATALLRDFKTLAVLLAVIAAAALALYGITGFLGRRNKTMKQELGGAVFAVWMTVAAELVQLWYWLVPRKGYEEPQIHLITVLLAALFLWRRADGRRRDMAAGLLGSLLTIAAVVYLSDMGIWYSVPHGLLGILFGAAVLIYALEARHGEKAAFWAYLLLFSLAFVSVFGKGFTLRAGRTETNTVLGVGGIIRRGPAAGILTNYMQAYIANCTYEEFQEYVEPGSSCLIVANMIGSAGTSPYLFNGSRISHFSVVDPTTYDAKLLDYWELYPEKKPEVIVVDCWYGQLMEDENSWIMQYIEGPFDYSDMVDGKYVRYYFRR